MTKLLVKTFIKDKDNVGEQSVRTAYGVLASIVGIIANIILFIIKIGIGMMINSISVMADGFNNLSDAISSVISYIGVKIADRPADEEHPFGHGRYEYIAALVVSFLVIEVGLSIFKSSFSKILKPEEVKFNLITIVVLTLSVGVKAWLVVFNRKLGKKINSSVMKATAADALGDVLITSITIISIIVAKMTGLKIDGYMGVIVAVIVMLSGIGIARETLRPLIGASLSRDLYQKITDMVEGYDKIIGTHDLIIHNYGPANHMASIHVEVPNDIDIEEAHEIIDKIEKDVLKHLGMLLVIHMDPIQVNNQILKKRETITKMICSIEPKASIHDFRVVHCDDRIRIIFELVIPYSYTKVEEKELLVKIMDGAKKIDSTYECQITVENSFIADE